MEEPVLLVVPLYFLEPILSPQLLKLLIPLLLVLYLKVNVCRLVILPVYVSKPIGHPNVGHFPERSDEVSRLLEQIFLVLNLMGCT
ncbi:hypothetical protein ES703_15676 [subsurface metagenome]